MASMAARSIVPSFLPPSFLHFFGHVFLHSSLHWFTIYSLFVHSLLCSFSSSFSRFIGAVSHCSFSSSFIRFIGAVSQPVLIMHLESRSVIHFHSCVSCAQSFTHSFNFCSFIQSATYSVTCRPRQQTIKNACHSEWVKVPYFFFRNIMGERVGDPILEILEGHEVWIHASLFCLASSAKVWTDICQEVVQMLDGISIWLCRPNMVILIWQCSVAKVNIQTAGKTTATGCA